jgi:hypothetical protein
MFNHRNLRKARLLRISSRDRLNKTEDNIYDFNLNFNDYGLHQVNKIIVKSVMIPNTEYNVNENNNEILFNYNGTGDLGFKLPIGQYDSASFITALEASFLGVGITVVVSQNSLTRKWVLTFDNPIVLYGRQEGSRLARVVGYEFTTDNLNVHPMPYLRDLVGLKKVFIGSNKLSNTTALISSDNRKVNVLTEVDITVPFGVVEHRVIDELQTTDEVQFPQPRNISDVDIVLYDDHLNVVDLNGHHFEIVFKVY